MDKKRIQKIYNLYELFNDFNRIRILMCIHNTTKNSIEIIKETGLNKTIVIEQLSFMTFNKVIKENNNTYKIIDKYVIKIIGDFIKYSNT